MKRRPLDGKCTVHISVVITMILGDYLVMTGPDTQETFQDGPETHAEMFLQYYMHSNVYNTDIHKWE